MSLYLDGISNYEFVAIQFLKKTTLEEIKIQERGCCDSLDNTNSFNVHIKGDGHWAKRHIIARIVLPIIAILSCLEAAIRQTLRGITFIICGLLSAKPTLIKKGFKDICSSIFQLSIAPFLGLLALINPDISEKVCYLLLSKKKIHEIWKSDYDGVVGKIANLTLRIFSIPYCIVGCLYRFAQDMSAGRFSEALSDMFELPFLPLVQLVNSVRGIFEQDVMKNTQYMYESRNYDVQYKNGRNLFYEQNNASDFKRSLI